MAEFFKWLSGNSIATNALLVSFVTLAALTGVVYVAAFLQGREISFWPPKIGAKPDKPTTSRDSSQSTDIQIQVPLSLRKELGLSFLVRKHRLGSGRQKDILDYIEKETSLHQLVSQDMVEEAFKEFAPSELYYRLEQLLLLGFLEKEQSGFIRGYPRFTYRLSSEYRKQISD
jgi:hypothetical protein